MWWWFSDESRPLGWNDVFASAILTLLGKWLSRKRPECRFVSLQEMGLAHWRPAVGDGSGQARSKKKRLAIRTKKEGGQRTERQGEKLKSFSKSWRRTRRYLKHTDLDATNAARRWKMFGREGAKWEYQRLQQAVNNRAAELDDESVRSSSELFITSRHFSAAAWARPCCHLLPTVCSAAALTDAWESINSMTLSVCTCVCAPR